MSHKDNTADWMEEEDQRAEGQAEAGTPPNTTAPQLIRKEIKSPSRATKGIYIQNKYAQAYDRLVFSQKMAKGMKAPELAEEAIGMLLKKYKINLED